MSRYLRRITLSSCDKYRAAINSFEKVVNDQNKLYSENMFLDAKVKVFKREIKDEYHVNLIQRALFLIENNHGILYKSSIGILKTGLNQAKEQDNFSDLEEFVPIFEKNYIRLKAQWEKEEHHKEQLRRRDMELLIAHYSVRQLEKKLAALERESLELKHKWDHRRPDERTQRKCRITNRADTVAKEILLIQDSLKVLKSYRV